MDSNFLYNDMMQAEDEDTAFANMFAEYYNIPQAHPFTGGINPPDYFPAPQPIGTPSMHIRAQGDGGKKPHRRPRLTFDNRSKKLMEKVFELTQYPDTWTREQIALHIGQDENRVSVWFKNRRAKQTRMDREFGAKPKRIERRGRYVEREGDADGGQQAARVLLERMASLRPTPFPPPVFAHPPIVPVFMKKEPRTHIKTEKVECPSYEMALLAAAANAENSPNLENPSEPTQSIRQIKIENLQPIIGSSFEEEEPAPTIGYHYLPPAEMNFDIYNAYLDPVYEDSFDGHVFNQQH